MHTFPTGRLLTRMVAALLPAALAACAGENKDAGVVRGRGLVPASLTMAAQASVYEAAIGASFDPDPLLVLMLHPRLLPRTEGYAGGEPVPAPLIAALRDRALISGTCEPEHDVERDTPRCPGSAVGYVIRATPVYLVGHDTVQINLAAEEFAAQSGARPQALRFEKIYQVVGAGSRWRVAREARMRESNR